MTTTLPLPTAPAEPAAAEATEATDQEFDHLDHLFTEFATLDGGPRRIELRDALVTGYLPLAQRMARKYRDRGIPVEDLVQVASIGLLNAVDRYDPQHESAFLSFALPTIQGEIRRHFRDRGWSMRVPRALKDRHLAIVKATSILSAELNRAPRPSELAAHLGISVDDVIEGLRAGEAYNSTSLDQQLTGGDSNGASFADTLGEADKRLEMVEYRDTLRPLLEALPERERTIVKLRFFGEMTQTRIATEVGVSQMHVSRLLSQTLIRLRHQLAED